jgi:hypothetical protein
VAIVGALVAAKLLPGRGAPEVQPAGESAGDLVGESVGEPASVSVTGIAVDTDPDRYPVYVPYISA